MIMRSTLQETWRAGLLRTKCGKILFTIRDGPATGRCDIRGEIPPQDSRMKLYLIYATAALAEIAGCFAFWAWLRMEKSAVWMLPGLVSLAAVAWLLSLVPTDTAGRAYAAYGGIYIAASLIWLWGVEGQVPDRWDMTGGAICLAGASLILFGPRG